MAVNERATAVEEKPTSTSPAGASGKRTMSNRTTHERRLGLWLSAPAFLVMIATSFGRDAVN